MKSEFLKLGNNQCVSLNLLPFFNNSDFLENIKTHVGNGMRIASYFCLNMKGNKGTLIAVLAHDKAGTLYAGGTDAGDSVKSIASECPQAGNFEREISEQYGIKFDDSPWHKPLRFHAPINGKSVAETGFKNYPGPGCANFFKVEGEEIHEVAVGPVHAGIIEPGHFRFHCSGEEVHFLEIALGYQHRGIEKKLINGPDKKTLHFMETAAGDTTIGHTTAFSNVVEGLSGQRINARSASIRAVLLELERIANHVGDIGALSNDVAFLPTSSYCGRLRGDFLNLTASICGNRFGRNAIIPGGVRFDISNDSLKIMIEKLSSLKAEVDDAIKLAFESSSVIDRFENTGLLRSDSAEKLGIVGPPARACGLGRDSRFDFPSGIFSMVQIPVSTWRKGDVFGRAYVRHSEIIRSIDFIINQLKTLPSGNIKTDLKPLKKNSMTVSLIEGFRGEVCHTAVTNDEGRFLRYKIVDPSFHNWQALAMVLRGEEISNFPLCNKSFNLSYCGHDL